MLGGRYENDWLFEKRTPRHGTLAAAAFAFSLIAHVVLFWQAPAFQFSRVFARRPAPTPRPPLVLKDVERQPPPPRLERPTEFSAEKPDTSFPSQAAPKEFVTALDPVLLDPPPAKADLAGQQVALREPGPVPPRPEWIPRQERVEIDRRLVREDPVAPPRRVLPDIPRVLDAPDIVPPAPPPVAETPQLASMPIPLPGVDLIAGGPSGTGGRGINPTALPDAGPRAEIGNPIRLEETSRAGTERRADVTDLQPIEQLLELTLRTFRPPDEKDAQYFSIHIARKGPASLPVLPRDVLFIQDCSWSMTQPKLDQCKLGLHAALKTLGPEDRFDVMIFRDKVERCFGQWTPADATARARAGWYIEQLESRGMTDIYGSLEQMLALPREAGRPMIALMASDGQPTAGIRDNFGIMQQFSERNQRQISVFAFGGGTKVNRFLLDFLSYKNRGDSLVVRQNAQIPQAMGGLAQELARPVLADLSFRFSGLDESGVFPRALTHLYLDRPLVIYGRMPVTASPAGLQITGRSGTVARDLVFKIDWAEAKPGNAELRTQWIWQKLNWAVGEHIRTRDPALLDEMQRLAARLDTDIPYAVELGLRKK